MKKYVVKYAPWITLVLALSGLSYWIWSRPSGTDVLTSEYFQPESAIAGTLLDEWKVFGFAGVPVSREDSLALALDLYGMAKYEEAKTSFKTYLTAYPDDFLARFYLGMSQLYLENYPEAYRILSPLSERGGFQMQDDARWYTALAVSNIDPVRAIGLFSAISRDDQSKYSEAAKMVMSSLKGRSNTFSFQVGQGEDEMLVGSLLIGTTYGWWQSTWFRALIAFLFPAGGAGLMFWRNRIRQLEQENEDIQKEKQATDELLLNMLPAEAAEELKKFGSSEIRRYENVTVLFCDIVGFTKIAEVLPAEELVKNLSECFEAYDHIITRQGLEKIKTVGDCYICTSRLFEDENAQQQGGSIQNVIIAAEDILEFQHLFNERQRAIGKPEFRVRIGVHTGPVVAGIVGVKKYAYDIWGDTVNIAARMETSGEPGRINISGSTYELVKSDFCCQYRGKIEAKGKGAVDMYFVG